MGTKRRNKLKVLLALVTSWMLVLIFAFYFTIGIYGIIGTSDGDHSVAILYLTFIVIILVFTVIWLGLYHFKQNLFVKFTRLAFLFGISLMVVIALGGTILIIIKDRDDSSVAQCSSLEDQLRDATGAIVPIATDTGTGTAFAIDNKGTLLTAYHVVEGAKKVYASYVSGNIKIKVLKTSKKFDVALLRMKQKTDTHLKLSNEYEVGDKLYAYGFPGNTFDAGQASLSGGLLSRVLTNSDLKLTSKSAPKGLELLQTDAAINPGNSGGPLISKCGVVGVVDAVSDRSGLHDYYGVVSEQGIGYAISSKTVAKKFKLPISK